MQVRALFLAACAIFVSNAVMAQNASRWNAMIGGGVGFPEGTSANFANNGANFVVGGGPNLTSYLGLDAEFMWHDLPIKQNVINALDVPNAEARVYSVTLNAIVPIPTHGKMGFYVIGGGGWYHRSGELTAPGIVPGTICEPFLIWMADCEDGLVRGQKVLASSSSDAAGGNIGGGITYKFGSGLKVFGEVRYHHASHNQVETGLLPLTLGVRW